MRRGQVLAAVAAVAAAAAIATAAAAQAPTARWSSLVADRSAARVGDSLTVLIYENASASNSSQHGSHKAAKLTGSASASLTKTNQAQASLAGDYSGTGQSSRSDQVVASISVLVTDVLANGDLKVAGQQSLMVNGGRTLIRVAGRVRPSDIAQDNTVLSSRIADASIVYDGAGFGQRPGLVARVLDRLGVF
jgi:flagellar L-ring protein precursor FlgH